MRSGSAAEVGIYVLLEGVEPDCVRGKLYTLEAMEGRVAWRREQNWIHCGA
jgi:hypothetical protein